MRKIVARIILVFLVSGMLMPIIAVPAEGDYKNLVTNNTEIVVETTIPIPVPTLRPEIQYIEPTTSDSCLTEIEQCESYIEYLDDFEDVEEEITRVENLLEQYTNKYEILLEKEIEEQLWGDKMAEYPEATQIWRIMKEKFGWSDTVCAGIMGNMMAEVAGGTLYALDRWDTNESSGYGLIQWIGQRRIDIKEKYGDTPTIEQQLYFMKDEMFGTNGVRRQINDAQLDAIMNADTPERVAYNFAVYFERCASYSYNCRKGYARIAYNYFVE